MKVQKKLIKRNMYIIKQFRCNGVFLSVKSRSLFLIESISQIRNSNFPRDFLKWIIAHKDCSTVCVLEMFTDDGRSVLLNAWVEGTARVAYMIGIARITFKLYTTYCWFTSEGFAFITFKSSEIYLFTYFPFFI